MVQPLSHGVTQMTFEQASAWYQQQADNLQKAGVRIRLFNDYHTVVNEEEAFIMAVKDEQAQKPLPNGRNI